MVSEERHGLSTSSKIFFATGLTAVLIISLGFLAWGKHRSNLSNNSLPPSVIRQIDSFRPYYLQPTYPTDFTLQQNTVKYAFGVLVFSLHNSTGKTLSVTEEATPSQYDPSTLHTTKQFNTEYGQAYITDSTDRTTGSLFTSDKTWVIVNAPSPVGSDFMQQFLEAFTPAKK